tara:strand:- start:130 stop:342 length:213 start_codon:yes stop_codon:yes gene_type:complete
MLLKIKSKSPKLNIERTVLKKEQSIYGNHYTLKCGWYVDYESKRKRWEITTLKKGEFIGRFLEKEITEIT